MSQHTSTHRETSTYLEIGHVEERGRKERNRGGDELNDWGDKFMTFSYIEKTQVCFREITVGFEEVTDKEMGNFIVLRYLENGFCEY